MARPISKARPAAALCGLLIAAACAHPPPPSPRPPLHPASAFDVCMAFERGHHNATVVTDALQRCEFGPLRLEETPALLEESRARCQPGKGRYDDFDKPMKAGRVAYDADQLQLCLTTARQSREGKPLWEFMAALQNSEAKRVCEAVLVPLTREGDVCIDDLECPVGTACEAADPTIQRFTCLRPAAIGERCETRTCDPATSFCIKGRCAAGPALGEACDPNQGCLAGASCNATTHRCEIEKIGGLGEHCGKCGDGLSCLASRCVGDLSLPPGTTCNEDRQCAGCSSCNAVLSSGGKVCAPRGETHAACAQTSDCKWGFVCAPDSQTSESHPVGRCVPRLAEGGRCASAEACSEGLVCDPVDGCTPPRAEGKGCHGKDVCAGGLSCVSDVCQPTPPTAPEACPSLAPTGAACQADDQCESKTCLPVEHVCSAKKPSGGCTGRGDFGTYLPLAFVFARRIRFRRLLR